MSRILILTNNLSCKWLLLYSFNLCNNFLLPKVNTNCVLANFPTLCLMICVINYSVKHFKDNNVQIKLESKNLVNLT